MSGCFSLCLPFGWRGGHLITFLDVVATKGIQLIRSMVLFLVSILSFVWRTGSELDPPERSPLSAHAALGPRIAVTGVFGLGMVFFAMIVKTLKSYSTHASGMEQRQKYHNSEQVISPRARDLDAAMERRGRERNRSVSGPRKREEAPERRRVVDMDDDKGGQGATMLGLGFMGMGLRNHDSSIHLDLEKGNVKETEKVIS